MGWRNEQRVTLSVGFILANQFTLSAFSLFADALRLAADEGDRSRPIRCAWQVMAPREVPVKSSCGVSVTPNAGLLPAKQLDYIAVVGGLLSAANPLDAQTVTYLREAAASGTKLIGVCTGAFLLARHGLMKGRRVCVSWYHHQDFVDEFPDHEVVADRLYLVDEDRLTVAGGSGVTDLAAYLIERHVGRAAAQKALHVLQVDRARRGEDAQPHPPMQNAATDERVRRGLLLMEQHMGSPLPISAIAERLSLSTRQLERLFRDAIGMRPATAYRHLRLRYASWLLDNTARTITDVALEAGFADCAHFSRQFRDMFGNTPTARRQGRVPPDAGAMLEGAAVDRRQFV